MASGLPSIVPMVASLFAGKAVSGLLGNLGKRAQQNAEEQRTDVGLPDPDSLANRVERERRFAQRYKEQGRVSSMFGSDKLG